MSSPKVSCHLITWGEDFITGLQEASSLGFRACETFTHMALQYEQRVEEFQELLHRYGFVLSALYGGGRFSDKAQQSDVIEYNTRVAEFLAKNGSDRIVFGPKGPRAAGGTPLEDLKTAAQTINEAAKRCADLGVKACVHPHLGTEIQDERELDVIMELTDPKYVHFCPDTAHLAKAGMNPEVILRRYRDRIAYVHLKDVTPDAVDVEAFPILSGNEALPIFCELGLGTLNFTPIIQCLQDIDYDGWLTVEIDQSTSTPRQSLTVCRDFVEQRLGIPVSAARL
ncbi:sugar phosphate isomerase/epimerase family protein [Alicyclobacillus shizuokensis]|uniref:sugar phosphate isomerase/epimerase family protein n=1 Tax=Alicyclobacillus shizuokensis TaxID=392014 RepID=UPI00083090EF|nr:sugar phosphate isomerase/epimerase [Alicyclobacillus shizuokensis]MCL6625679.1 sugar phosphate isomerase/epimerase [Alicyclobacillus shizuokensis]